MGLFKLFKRLTKKHHRNQAARKKKSSKAPRHPRPVSSGYSKSAKSSSVSSSSVNSGKPRSVRSTVRAKFRSSASSSESISQKNSHVASLRHVSASNASKSSAVSSDLRSRASVNLQSSSSTESSSTIDHRSQASVSSQVSSSVASSSSTKSRVSSQSSETGSKASRSDHVTRTRQKSQPSRDQTQIYARGLAKSRSRFGQKLNHLFANFRSVNEEFFDNLEDTLIEADVGVKLAVKLTDELRNEVKLRNVKKRSAVQDVIIKKLIDLYDQSGQHEDHRIHFAKHGPTVFLFVGVNGAGKTTTIGKMAHMYHQQGKKVLLAAADTFRAGAIEQLDDWAQMDHVDIVKKPAHSDPSSVVYDAVHKAKRENYDVLFVDTAGRLQNKVNLMNQLAKMKRVLTRVIPQAPHEVILVLDATVGQNALSQAKLFKKVTNVTGIILTKLDGTAKGGIVLAIRNELHLPVKYVGLGEHVDDLAPFHASNFVYGLFAGLFK